MGGKSSKDAGRKGASASRRRSLKSKGDQSFGREYSLKEDLAIKRVFRFGKKFEGRCLVIYHYGSGSLPLKIALKVKKNIGSSPRRNRIKRIIREVIRTNKGKFKNSGHLVISAIFDPGDETLFENIEKDLLDFAQAR
ncbi:MAG: ribonuclease P protein component [candidate division Zixibacteria bacterium]|nr:ribonuclease P protein component [candidate division Zixibacteria bacterium]NIR62300.1 ribonuclease P protein component [candidate division Zixibacteria bacterium]NIS15761.1 ribonuclease P protein component [candidate division Zixibacteria bacterium]NIS48505.1 ribonuclease P protein component [candidate division Zixibacteria bacterium]NIT52242.1 ribonuclease P protein component [candidate division Zixibacteria bacterium]